jgi:hypothetical protein
MGVHVPGVTAHVRHPPVQVSLQQIPWTQLPLEHWLPRVQISPFCLLHTPVVPLVMAQEYPAAHSLPPDVHWVAQAVPTHR